MYRTKIWGEPDLATILVIGSDPFYQKVGDELPRASFYADVFFRKGHLSEKDEAKYLYAQKVFDYINLLVGEDVKKENVYLLDLHPIEPDPFPPLGEETLITELGAHMGLTDIQYALKECPKINTIIAMGPQVNRWLQLLNFYWSGQSVIEGLRPDSYKVIVDNPYYKAVDPSLFDKIAYKTFSPLEYPFKTLIPIHHINQIDKVLLNFKWKEKFENVKKIINSPEFRESYVVFGEHHHSN
ncbi:MAG: hypothetical protein ACEPOW_06625 [Bacteroidales bacterium]